MVIIAMVVCDIEYVIFSFVVDFISLGLGLSHVSLSLSLGGHGLMVLWSWSLIVFLSQSCGLMVL